MEDHMAQRVIEAIERLTPYPVRSTRQVWDKERDAYIFINTACRDCEYFGTNRGADDSAGICRRRPPTVVRWPNHGDTVWPAVYPTDWCSEFLSKE